MAKTAKAMLNNSGESGHPCLVPDLSGNGFSFSPLKMMVAVGLKPLLWETATRRQHFSFTKSAYFGNRALLKVVV